jgi:Domain of unknown function (DUF6916)
MLELDKVRLEHFTPCLNQDFEVVLADGTLPVKLIEAKQWGPDQPPDVRQPFTLTFRVERNLRFPQGIYRMKNAQLGEIEIFLVQVAADQNSSTLEAVFN